ncbi:MAG TPA: putative ABC exporter domain-containing protein [Nitrososphaerales archaeon]|nr:putative ABC exporter domain-containing protein [Nitrososphaerales archaeon]
MNSWSAVATLVRYWAKGRFTRAIVVWMVIGEAFALVFVLFIGGTVISFSSRFNLGSSISDTSLSLIFAFFLVGLVQSGFNGSGLPVSSADVDYVFTSPVRPREVFAAKVLMNSVTTVLLSFPPILALYLRFADSYGTSDAAAVLAGMVTLAFFVIGLFLSADITLSLNSRLGPRLRLFRNGLMAGVVVVSLVPIALLIPGTPPLLGEAVDFLPNGLAAKVSFDILSGARWTADAGLSLAALGAWFVGLLALGVRMSKAQFYEVLRLEDADASSTEDPAQRGSSRLETTGRSVWEVVREKERVMMSRTKETRSMLINTLFLAGFMVIYSLSGVFQSSPTSFLFILFIIGSFGSGTAARWLEKERLWVIKTSPLDLTRYVREAYRARVTPLLLLLSPVATAVGAPLILGDLKHPTALLSVGLSLPGALEVAAIMMAGGMYFAARYGQSTSDDLLLAQGQDLTDVKRFLYQTLINLLVVSPIMALVLAAGPVVTVLGGSSLVPLTAVFLVVALAYTVLALNYLLSAAGRSLQAREDL